MKNLKLQFGTTSNYLNLFHTFIIAVVIFISAGVMNTIKIYAGWEEDSLHWVETACKPRERLVLWQDYRQNYNMLNAIYQDRYGMPWNPTDTAFFYNPDGVMLDTFYNVVWVKKYWQLGFKDNIIPMSETHDFKSITYYTIDDILPEYQSVKNDFIQLKHKWGEFKFVDYYHRTYEPYPGNLTRALWLEFENYVPVYSYNCDYDTLIESPQDDFEKMKCLSEYPACYELGTITGLFQVPSLTTINSISTFKELRILPNKNSNGIIIFLPDEILQLPNILKILNSEGKVHKQYATGIMPTLEINISEFPLGKYWVQVGNYQGCFIKE